MRQIEAKASQSFLAFVHFHFDEHFDYSLGLVLSGAIKFIPSQIIPISGMIASNSMVAIGLCYKQMKTKFHDEHQRIEEKLALELNRFKHAQTLFKRASKPECSRRLILPKRTASSVFRE